MRHPLVALGGPRALLLELADPAIADAVARFSSFQNEPFARLARTLAVMGAIAFGSPAQSSEAATALWRRHARIKSRDTGGRSYEANDPHLLLWVHATLVDTVLAVERRYLGLLDDASRADYYAESRLVGRAVGIPVRLLPADLGSFEDYFYGTLDGLEVSDEARRLAKAVLAPSPSSVPAAALLLRQSVASLTADLLPVGLRRAYGLDSLAFEASWPVRGAGSALSRAVAPRLPPPALRWMSGLAASMFLGGTRLAET